MSQSGPLVVITGAMFRALGWGRAGLRPPGTRLALLARHMTEPAELAGLPLLCVDADVGDFAALDKAVREAEEKFGPTDCLINSAGMADARSFSQVAAADYEREIRTNLLETMNGIKAVFDGMLARKRGTIINITSVSDRKTCAVSVGYTASKYGARAVSSSLREAAGSAGVRVINIAPGYVRTHIHQNMGISFEKYEEMLGYPDFMTADELADIIRYCYELPAHLCIRDLVVAPTRTLF